MNPFQTFKIVPFYGAGQAVIQWSLFLGLSGNVYFYRSDDGVSWKALNPDTPATGISGEFLDPTVGSDPLNIVYYRGMVDPGGGPDTWMDGPAVTDCLRRRFWRMPELS